MNPAELFALIRSKKVPFSRGEIDSSSHKSYVRMPRTRLNDVDVAVPLQELFASRHSFRSFDDLPRVLGATELSAILGAARIRNDGRRPHPSGGGLYPIETYLYSTGIENVPDGYHHYEPAAHVLEHLWNGTPPYASERAPRVDIFFTALWGRQSHKYGLRSVGLALLEAGHVAQDIMLAATAVQVHLRPWFGFQQDIVDAALDLRAGEESTVYGLRLFPPPSTI